MMMTNARTLATRTGMCHRTWLENIGDVNDLNVASRPTTSMVYGEIHKTNYNISAANPRKATKGNYQAKQTLQKVCNGIGYLAALKR